jgi:hypothetical protein
MANVPHFSSWPDLIAYTRARISPCNTGPPGFLLSRSWSSMAATSTQLALAFRPDMRLIGALSVEGAPELER